MKKTNNSLSKIAEVKMSYRSLVPPTKRIKVRSAQEAYDLLRTNWDNDQIEFIEVFKVLLLNSANDVLGVLVASVGNVDGTSANIRKIFQSIILSNATGFCLAHNHPSGDIIPSESDIDTTRKIKEIANLFDIRVVDHLILNALDYFSFNDNGLL